MNDEFDDDSEEKDKRELEEDEEVGKERYNRVAGETSWQY